MTENAETAKINKSLLRERKKRMLYMWGDYLLLLRVTSYKE